MHRENRSSEIAEAGLEVACVKHVSNMAFDGNYVKNSLAILDVNFQEADIHNILSNCLYTKRARDARKRTIGVPSLFGEPGWDMLIEIFIAQIDKRLISLTSACMGADIPIATGLRWLRVLESEGFVERVDDVKDKRRTNVSLSQMGLFKMIKYFSNMNLNIA